MLCAGRGVVAVTHHLQRHPIRYSISFINIKILIMALKIHNSTAGHRHGKPPLSANASERLLDSALARGMLSFLRQRLEHRLRVLGRAPELVEDAG